MTQSGTPAPTRGVPVVLDRERRLRYTFATRRKMMEEFGGEEKFTQLELTGETLVRVLWFGLAHEDPNLTGDQLEEMLDMENIKDVVDALLKALGYRGRLEIAPGAAGANPPPAAAESASG